MTILIMKSILPGFHFDDLPLLVASHLTIENADLYSYTGSFLLIYRKHRHENPSHMPALNDLVFVFSCLCPQLQQLILK